MPLPPTVPESSSPPRPTLSLPRTPKNLQKAVRRARVPLGTLITLIFLALAQPSWTSIGASLAFVLPGLWVRAWAAGTLRKKEALATTGPYAFTRNPLYLGSTLLAVGFAVASGRWPLGIVLAVVFYTVYRQTILDEEEFLRLRYEGFDAYTLAVPRFFPRLTPARLDRDGGGFSRGVYVKNREYQALLGGRRIIKKLIVRILLSHRG